MAITTTPIGDPISGMGLYHDTDMDENLVANVRQGATKLHLVEVDNSANGAVSYFKVYDALTATPGTTDPDMVLPISASGRRVYLFTEDDVMGMTVSNGISHATLTTGGTGGTTGPTSAVTGNILADA